MLRFVTAGESHGRGLVAVLEGIPAGLALSQEHIQKELYRRQQGFGRGGRMKIEHDTAEIYSGVRHGLTIGSPISLIIKNRDWDNWSDRMSVASIPSGVTPETAPRPGHADLTGALKTGQNDIRNILERASARETAARVALGAIAKRLLSEIDISIISHVVQIGSVHVEGSFDLGPADLETVDASPVRCYEPDSSERMIEEIKAAAAAKDTVGGLFEVIVFGCPPGLGGYSSWDRKLDANLARALTSIPAIKAVEFGDGFSLGGRRGSKAHDEIAFDQAKGYSRATNRAGGIEGGMSNGEPIIIRAAMKPIPTLKAGLKTVDIKTKEEAVALSERSDICAVPSAAIIGESMSALELAKEALIKFGSDSLTELKRNISGYLNQISP